MRSRFGPTMVLIEDEIALEFQVAFQYLSTFLTVSFSRW